MAVALIGGITQSFDDAGIPYQLSDAIRDKTPGSTIFIILTTLAECKQAMEELRLFLPSAKSLVLSGLELLPLDPEFASSRLVTERIRSLSHFYSEKEYDIVLTTPDVLFERLPGPGEVSKSQAIVLAEDSLDDLVIKLAGLRYESNSHLSTDGCYARRNNEILDIWPSGEDFGVRLIHGESGNTAYRFALDTRRRREELKLPITLCHRLHIRLQEDSIAKFRRNYRELVDEATKSPIYIEASKGEVNECLAMMAPLLYIDDCVVLERRVFAGIVWSSASLKATLEYPSRINRRLRQLRQTKLASFKYFPPIESIYWPMSTALRVVSEMPEEAERPQTMVRPRLVHHFDLEKMMADLSALEAEAKKVVIVYQTEARREPIETILVMLDWPFYEANTYEDAIASNTKVCMLRGSLSRSLMDKSSGILILCEMALFGFAVADKGDEGSYSVTRDLYSLRYLHKGDPLVHREMGIGRFLDVSLLKLSDGSEQDYLAIGFAEGGVTYTKMIDLDLISRYGGTDMEKAPLHKVNEPAWQKAVRDANHSIFETASGILRRRSKKRIATYTVEEPDYAYQRFASEFPFQETRDQQAAIDAIISDLQSGYLMDRLVCGDVGFGKTEVAMRAAFLVTQIGGLVMLLAPTTVLAEQHFRSFRRRFASFPQVKIGLVMGENKAESRQTLAGAAMGKIHIVIGTHRLLQSDVPTANIGLIIIDEEQRFGVEQKENADLLRSNTHMLSTTATPIPRTLSSAMAGLRQMSIISTPPAKRLSVRTSVSAWDDNVILTAIDREIQRSGQVFVVAPTIDLMTDMSHHISSLRRELRTGTASGRMDTGELTEAMRQFYDHELDILFCTTVIESGIDVPNANTMIIVQAENFGLSQLHQLRGRVGRSDRQAYAYLMTMGKKVPDSAAARLAAFAASKSLGEGYLLAQQDLEIRGAGEILGESQSGHIHEVGYHLYMEMLQHTIKTLSKNRGSEVGTGMRTHVDLSIPGRLSPEWIADPGERISAYKRLLAADSLEALTAIWEELQDVFGEAGRAEQQLLSTMNLRLSAESANLERLVERQNQWRLFARRGETASENALAELASMVGYEYVDGAMTADDVTENHIRGLLMRLQEG